MQSLWIHHRYLVYNLCIPEFRDLNPETDQEVPKVVGASQSLHEELVKLLGWEIEYSDDGTMNQTHQVGRWLCASSETNGFYRPNIPNQKLKYDFHHFRIVESQFDPLAPANLQLDKKGLFPKEKITAQPIIHPVTTMIIPNQTIEECRISTDHCHKQQTRGWRLGSCMCDTLCLAETPQTQKNQNPENR
jgi:hypothetical protein